MDEMYSSIRQSSTLNLQTPLAYSIATDSITNAIVVSAKNSEYYTYNKIIEDLLNNMRATMP